MFIVVPDLKVQSIFGEKNRGGVFIRTSVNLIWDLPHKHTQRFIS